MSTAPAAAFDITVTIDQDRAQMTLVGEIHMNTADAVLMNAHWYLGIPQVKHVVADLAAVTFIDSSGLGALMRCRQAADELGKTFVVHNHHGRIADVIDIVGLTRYLTDPTHQPT